MSQSETKNTVTLTLPSWFMAATKVKDYAKQTIEKGEEIKENNIKNPLKKIPTDKIKKVATNFLNKVKQKPKISIAVIIVVLISVVLVTGLSGKSNNSVVSGITSNTDYSPDKIATVNKTIEIPIREQDGEDTGQKLKITFSTIDKAKRILIKGQGATAREGKVFLILNMEIENDSTNQLTVRPVDFIRLIESDDRSFAPDVHNDDVEVEAISIKKTRVGYVVNEEVSIFSFAIGEISGDKDLIEVQI